jgi:hypothetical protein
MKIGSFTNSENGTKVLISQSIPVRHKNNMGKYAFMGIKRFVITSRLK